MKDDLLPSAHFLPNPLLQAVPFSEAYLMDCVEAMRRYEDNCFDLAMIDLEYGIGASKPSIKPCSAIQKNGSRLLIKQPNYTPKKWDFKLSDQTYFDELFRVSKQQIIFGATYYGLSGGMLVWDKLNGASDQMDCEIAYCSFNKRCDLVYYLWAGMFQGVYCGKEVRKALVQQGNKQLNEKRIHPTQKPVALYDWIFNNYTKEGQTVIDTHLGSGSSRIAARKNKLNFVGFEIDEEYFNKQEKRYAEFVSQLRMF